MLSIEGLVTGYDRLEVLHGVDLAVDAKQAVAVVGANGAGKSTLCRALSGLIKVRGGSIRFDGQDITHASTSARVRAGVIQVPEGRQVFPQMTVLENLVLGAFVHGAPRDADLEPIFALFPILRERRDQPAGMLSGGEQQLLALARAMMSRPRLLILDEPSQGLSPRPCPWWPTRSPRSAVAASRSCSSNRTCRSPPPWHRWPTCWRTASP